jgi:predicted acyltransferase
MPETTNDAPAEAPLLAPVAVRSSALDILRGLAIFTMVLSGTIPYKVLPAWMYHAQLPPPTHKFDPTLAGLSWVDLVFPFFLFSLGAALPLALSKKLSIPGGWKAAIVDGFRRFGLLLFFAVATWHLNPIRLNGWSAEHGSLTWLSGIASCIAFTLVLGRFPSSWNRGIIWAVRLVGWGLAAFLITRLPALHGKSFALRQSDIILVVLSNVALFGTLVMVLFKSAPKWRWLVLMLGLILHAARQFPDNPLRAITDMKPLGWLIGPGGMEWILWAFHPRYLKYLFIVIPGMAVGDILVRYLAERQTEVADNASKSRGDGARGFAVLFLALAATACFLGFYQSRQVLMAGASLVVIGIAITVVIVALPQGAPRTALTRILSLAAIAVGLGFALEPYQGGAKKDYATLSYYAFGSGFAALNLAGFLAWEAFGKLGPVSRLLAANGRNPMLAYIASAFLIQPLFRVTGAWEPLVKATAQPWTGAGRAFLMTLLGALLVALLGRLRIVWRS